MNEISNWTEEKRAAYLYRVVAACEAGTPREKLFLGLAGEAEGQAAIWGKKALAAGVAVDRIAGDVIYGRDGARNAEHFAPGAGFIPGKSRAGCLAAVRATQSFHRPDRRPAVAMRVG